MFTRTFISTVFFSVGLILSSSAQAQSPTSACAPSVCGPFLGAIGSNIVCGDSNGAECFKVFTPTGQEMRVSDLTTGSTGLVKQLDRTGTWVQVLKFTGFLGWERQANGNWMAKFKVN